MSYTRAHLAELGLTLWRSRAASAAEVEPVADVPESVPVPVSEARPAQTAPARPSTPPPQAPAEAQLSADRRDEEEAAAARRAAIARMDWAALEAYVKSQSRGDAQQAVFGVGARDARVMVIGEAPGAEEDRRGEPFVG